eukprot:2833321-Rhodomonas_salina.1
MTTSKSKLTSAHGTTIPTKCVPCRHRALESERGVGTYMALTFAGETGGEPCSGRRLDSRTAWVRTGQGT